MKLDANQKHMLKLIAKEQDCPEGWALVGKQIYPLLVEIIPPELAEHHPIGDEGCGQARLTAKGESIVAAMEWL